MSSELFSELKTFLKLELEQSEARIRADLVEIKIIAASLAKKAKSDDPHQV